MKGSVLSESQFKYLINPCTIGDCHIGLWWRTFPATQKVLLDRAGPDMCMHAKWLRLCRTFFDPLDCSPPGSSVRGILQARILEWVAMSFSRGSSQPRDRPSTSSFSCIGRRVLGPPGKPVPDIVTCKCLLNRINNNLLAHSSQLLLNVQTLTLFDKVIVGVFLPKIL